MTIKAILETIILFSLYQAATLIDFLHTATLIIHPYLAKECIAMDVG